MADRVLVTGAAGFIGSHLCRRLVAEGHEVVGLDDLSEGSLDNLRNVPEVRFEEADLRERDAVARAARGCATIFHHGAKRAVPRSMAFPVETTEVNVIGTLTVLLAAAEQNSIVVFASSSSVYGDQDVFPLSEGMEPRPRSPYAASKLAGEVTCAAFFRSHGVRTVALRYFNVYGPGQDPENEYAAVIPRFVLARLTGARPIIFGDGEQARDFTYIDDVVEANLAAARATERAFGRAFNIGGGERPTSVSHLLRLIDELTGGGPEPIMEPPRAGDVRLTEADVARAGELLGYRPSVPVREGIRRTVEHFRSSAPTRVETALACGG
ncbi:MAG TPA: NAD-dependent epimerase/dehydratase family protein [Actinomycetota bacterium]|jgi:UDP-glucose 4-epimerase|nr:NAD-dependent epimerase/dehydratase family protein [Actinomycetota bacterium]